MSLRLQHITHALQDDREIVLPLRVCRIARRPAYGDGQHRLVSRQRSRAISLGHQHITDPVESARPGRPTQVREALQQKGSRSIGWAGPPTHLHRERLAFLRQHCPFPDQRQLVLLAWMVSGLLLSQTVCFDRWKTVLPMAHAGGQLAAALPTLAGQLAD